VSCGHVPKVRGTNHQSPRMYVVSEPMRPSYIENLHGYAWCNGWRSNRREYSLL